jgi:hypothetical protein
MSKDGTPIKSEEEEELHIHAQDGSRTPPPPHLRTSLLLGASLSASPQQSPTLTLHKPLPSLHPMTTAEHLPDTWYTTGEKLMARKDFPASMTSQRPLVSAAGPHLAAPQTPTASASTITPKYTSLAVLPPIRDTKQAPVSMLSPQISNFSTGARMAPVLPALLGSNSVSLKSEPSMTPSS